MLILLVLNIFNLFLLIVFIVSLYVWESFFISLCVLCIVFVLLIVLFNLSNSLNSLMSFFYSVIACSTIILYINSLEVFLVLLLSLFFYTIVLSLFLVFFNKMFLSFKSKFSSFSVNNVYLVFIMVCNILLLLFFVLIMFITYEVCFCGYLFKLFKFFNVCEHEAHTFFYFFKYDFNWLVIYLWAIPVVSILCMECLMLMFFFCGEGKGGYGPSDKFSDSISYWYHHGGEKDINNFHNFFHHPFKFMGSCFKFSGNHLDISSSESVLVYLSSLFLLIFIVIVWVQSLFLSIPIHSLVWNFIPNSEPVYFGKSFKFVCGNGLSFGFILLVLVNLHLAISFMIIPFFIICFAGNLYINYNVLSGEDYEPLYEQVIDGYMYCIVTPSQFSVFHNIWYYNGVHWVLEETPLCKELAVEIGNGNKNYCLSPVSTSLSLIKS